MVEGRRSAAAQKDNAIDDIYSSIKKLDCCHCCAWATHNLDGDSAQHHDPELSKKELRRFAAATTCEKQIDFLRRKGQSRRDRMQSCFLHLLQLGCHCGKLKGLDRESMQNVKCLYK
jgi:hypothetical protein